MFGKVYSTNWTLDGIPIEDGFKIADLLDEEDGEGSPVEAGRKTASHRPTVARRLEWNGMDEDYVWAFVDDEDHEGDVRTVTVTYQDPELYGPHEEGDWQWALRDRRDMEIEYGYSPTKEDAILEAESQLTGQMPLFASRTAKDEPETDEPKLCEAVVAWDAPGANGRVLCGEDAVASLELYDHTYLYCKQHRDAFMESAGRNSIAKDVKEKEASVALEGSITPRLQLIDLPLGYLLK